MSGLKILIIEDGRETAELLHDSLTLYEFNVLILNHGDHVTQKVRSNPPDLVILDISISGNDGMSICKEIRSFSDVPIIILNLKADENDCIHGFESGADDYLYKPFSPREVVARVRAILRRKSFAESSEKDLSAGPLTINSGSYYATISGKRLNLTLIEFELLKFMASMPNNVFSRIDLVTCLQGYEVKCSERAIDCHIKNLRKKLYQCHPENNLINTVYGVGYSLTVP